MLKVDNNQRNTIGSINLSNTISQYLNITMNEEKNSESKKTSNKRTSSDIYQTIRKKASIINSDKRTVQDKISIIQSQEQKIETIENTLKQARNEYIQAIKNGQREEVKQKIKVRQLNRQINELKNKTKEEENNKQEKISDKNHIENQNHIQDENKLLEKVNEILRRIKSTKSKLEQYKSELMILSQDITSNKKKVEAQESEFIYYLEESEYITNGLEINLTDYTDLNGNISTGLIISIYI